MVSHRGGVVRLALGLTAASLALVAGSALADPWASEPPVDAWVSTNDEVVLRAAPTLEAERLEVVRAGTALRIMRVGQQWLQVYDPRSETSAYVRSDLVSGATPPTRFFYEEAPPIEADMDAIGVATEDRPLYVYPSHDAAAELTVLQASRRESIVGIVAGSDGESWYRTADGYFLPSEQLFLSSAPEDYGGRWLDVKLTGAARVVAFDGGAQVRSFNAIKGTARFPTPLGVWSIVRRVYNETMDSTTVGIPRFSAGGYYLQNVLYTQYFRETGESLHYNWWSSAWGAPGSHGCLGLSFADSKWLWEWADVGTPVVIHS